MDELFRRITQTLHSLLGELPVSSLSLGGLLSLGALVYGLYQLRGPQDAPRDRPQAAGPGDPHSSGAASLAGPSAAAAPGQPAAPPAALSGLALVTRRLAGATCVTVSVPGVLLEERTPGQLEESATVLPAAAEVVRHMLSGASVYLLAQVDSDVGEAVVRAVLDHAGLLGRGAGQLPPHRLLFCGSLDGKVSVVRQLEPGLHVDAHPGTVHALQRFVPRLLLVATPGEGGAAAGSSSNVEVCRGLAAAFGADGS